jgi:hypothetical protein
VGRFSATTCGKIFSILIVQDTINLAGQMLLSWKDSSKSDDEEVTKTIDEVQDLLGKWHEVFHLLRPPKWKKGMKGKPRGLIKKAIAKHRDLGLSITHKVHLIEDHVVE